MGRPPRCRRQEAVRGLPPAWASRDSVPRSSSRRGRGGARARATRLRRRALEEEAPGTVEVRTVNAISDAGRDEWDACAGRANPFVSWDFLHCLEASGSATREEGWLPLHLLAREQATGELVGCVPLYLKSHSMGEYVFDQSWAEAHYQLTGKNYYPKLQSCVPFSPVTGPRLLARPADAERARAVKATLGRALVTVADEMQASSLHVTFNTEEEWALLPEAAGDFLQRRGKQYHWMNRDYSSFADFEMALKQKKRKNVRQERRRVAKAGLRMERLMGSEVPPALWDTFYSFYRDTADRKWGSAYLTREFFHAVGEAMGDRVLLVVAREEATGEVIAGAINFVGEDTLFGRNWGCKRGSYVNSLHFETCYYQAIEFAIEQGLRQVEAGAQGQETKMARGYVPRPTFSSHYLPGGGNATQFRNAVARFLAQESADIERTIAFLGTQVDVFKDAG